MIVAVLDACVLYPPSLRDLLMRLATRGIFAPRWTSEIQSEWVRNALANNAAMSSEQLERTCRLMELVDRNCEVTGYEGYIPVLHLPDPNDRHVLAAAIQASASHIVTYNLSDFPASVLEEHRVKAKHPDIFLAALMDENPVPFIEAVRAHRAALKNPPKSVEDYIDTLRVNRLNELALRLEAYREEL